MGFQRSVAIVKTWAFGCRWPDLLHARLAVSCNFLDACWAKNLQGSFAELALLLLLRHRVFARVIALRYLVTPSHMRSNQVVTERLMDREIRRVDVLLEVSASVVGLDLGMA